MEAVTIALLLWPRPLAAQEFLSRAKELYEAANYEAALKSLDSAGRDTLTPDQRQSAREYRALTLLALDRPEEMAKTIEEMIELDPFYHPARDRTPRFLSLFDRIHSRLLPSIVQERYSEARAHLENRRYTESAVGFELVLRLIKEAGTGAAASDPQPAGQWLSDMRSNTVRVLEQIRAAQEPAAREAPNGVPAQTVYRRADAGVTPPIPLRQDVPPWQSAQFDRAEVTGEIALLIDVHGDVADARITVPIHPSYDPVLLSATTQWKYGPATKDGQPVSYYKLIPISLVARRNLAAASRPNQKTASTCTSPRTSNLPSGLHACASQPIGRQTQEEIGVNSGRRPTS
jgi:hypothetical protein